MFFFQCVFNVSNVIGVSGYVIHQGEFTQSLVVNPKDQFFSNVNLDKRKANMRAHTAAHLLNYAVRFVIFKIADKTFSCLII